MIYFSSATPLFEYPSMENNQDRKGSMDDEERKQVARRVPPAELDLVHSDFAIAMALQEQERAFNIITSTESNSEEEEEGEDDDNYDDDDGEFFSQGNNGNDYEFFESQEFEFLEGQDSNSEDLEHEDDMEEDDIDPDELSYEELVALGDFIGEEKRGLSLHQISKCLHPGKYQGLETNNGIDRCVICQAEYEEGESLVALPCDHPYHSECISNWLQIKKICPICSCEVSSPKIC